MIIYNLWFTWFTQIKEISYLVFALKNIGPSKNGSLRSWGFGRPSGINQNGTRFGQIKQASTSSFVLNKRMAWVGKYNDPLIASC